VPLGEVWFIYERASIAGHSNMYTTHSTVTQTHTPHSHTQHTQTQFVYIFSTASRLKFGRTSNYKASLVTGIFITTLRRFRPKCVLRTPRNCKYEKSAHGAFLPHNCFPVRGAQHPRLSGIPMIYINSCCFTNKRNRSRLGAN
jgi:hypothetical protein